MPNHIFSGWCFDIRKEPEQSDWTPKYTLCFYEQGEFQPDEWDETQALWIEGMFHSVGVEMDELQEDCYGIHNDIDCRRVMFALTDAGLDPRTYANPDSTHPGNVDDRSASIFYLGSGAEWARRVRESR